MLFTEVKVIFTEEKPRSTEVKSRLTVVKPRFTECAVRFIEVLDPSGNRDSITSRGAKRPCRHGARAQKTALLEHRSEMCCYSLSFPKFANKKMRVFAKKTLVSPADVCPCLCEHMLRKRGHHLTTARSFQFLLDI